VLNIGVVGTFATGWLLARLDDFAATHPHIDLLRVDQQQSGRSGGGGAGLCHPFRRRRVARHPCRAADGGAADPALRAAGRPRLREPGDLVRERLLRSYRVSEWESWFAAAGAPAPALRGPMFDSSALMVAAAMAGLASRSRPK
jgi:LysR family transcriptional regulator of beta-lactamase